MNKKLEATGFIRELVSINEDGTETWIEKPFYMYPKEWQGLSDEEIDYCETFYAPPMHSDYIKDDNWYNFIKAIEQKLKEKNS